MKTLVSGRSISLRANRVTLVLGGGWKLGCSFHAGVMLALKDAWGLDARQVDSVIGTSSGAVVAGLLGAGMSPDDLFRRESADKLSPAGQALMDRLGHGDHDDQGHRARAARVGSPQELHPTLGLSVRGVLAAMLPRGRESMVRLEQYFDDLMGPAWPTHMDLRFCAVDLGNGQRVALDWASGATVGQAVAASCSVPGVSQPVMIKGREYVDGAIYSINNADLAAVSGRTGPGGGPNLGVTSSTEESSTEESSTEGKHTVIVSAPLSVNRLRMRLGPMGVLRNAMHLQTAAEVRKLRDIDQLLVLEPTMADIAAMGSDMNADGRRAFVADSAYTSAIDIFRSAEAPSSTDLFGAPRA